MKAILDNLWPLGGNSKDKKVANGYWGIEPEALGCHAHTLTTALPPPQYIQNNQRSGINKFSSFTQNPNVFLLFYSRVRFVRITSG